MPKASFTMKPSMLWDGKLRKQTPEEIAKRVAALRKVAAQIAEDEKTDPLPDDFIDYCKGRKWIGAVQK
jgi:hypothetical protein